MEAINELTRLARERRDKLIAKIQDEYKATLDRIAAIERDLQGSHSFTHQRLGSCVSAAIPAREPFTASDVLRTLEANDPKRHWRIRSVNSAIMRLRKNGIVRLLKPCRSIPGGNGSQPALYVRAESASQAGPFAEMCFRDVLFHVLEGRSMTLIELTVAVLEAGYQTAMRGMALQRYARQTLLVDSRFRRSGDRWSC